MYNDHAVPARDPRVERQRMNESNRNESMQYYSYTAVTKSIVALAAFAAASMIDGNNLAQQLVTPLVRLLSASSSSNSSAISATTRSAYGGIKRLGK